MMNRLASTQSLARVEAALELDDFRRALEICLTESALLERCGNHTDALVLCNAVVQAATSVGMVPVSIWERIGWCSLEIDRSEAIVRIEDAATEFARHGDIESAAQLRVHLFIMAWGAARETLALSANPAGRSWSRLVVAFADIGRGEWAAAHEHACAVQMQAESDGDELLNAISLWAMSWGFAGRGELDQAVVTARSAAQRAEAIGAWRLVVEMRCSLVSFATELLDLDAARAELEQLQGITRETKSGLVFALVNQNASLVAALRGQSRLARSFAAAAAAAGGDSVDACAALVLAAQVAIENGHDDGQHSLAIARSHPRACDAPWSAFLDVLESLHIALETHCGKLPSKSIIDQTFAVGPTASGLMALWMARSALRYRNIAAAELSQQILDRLEDADEHVELNLRVAEAKACLAALAATDTTHAADELLQISDRWKVAGFDAEAARAECESLMAGNVAAKQTSALLRLHSTFAACESMHDCAIVTSMLDGADELPTLSFLPLFAGLADFELERVQAHVIPCKFETGVDIVGPGHGNDRIYVVVDGAAQVRHVMRDGKQFISAMLGPGDVLDTTSHDESSVLEAVYAQAVRPVRMIAIERKRVRELSAAIPRFGLNLLESIREQSAHMHDLAAQIALGTVEQRVAQRLIDLDRRFGHPRLDGSRIINVRLTQTELAELVGSSRKSVTLLLSALRKDGIVGSDAGRFVVHDLEALRMRAVG